VVGGQKRTPARSLGDQAKWLEERIEHIEHAIVEG
jgi:hypothetical protein